MFATIGAVSGENASIAANWQNVDVLETLFQKTPSEAYRVMMQVHLNGRGIAGVYPFEVAETKVDSLLDLAREAGHPLQATIEDA